MPITVNNSYDCYVAISTKSWLLGDNISKGIKSRNLLIERQTLQEIQLPEGRTNHTPFSEIWSVSKWVLNCVHICICRITVISLTHILFFSILIPLNIPTYFFSIINLSSLLPPSKSFFILVVSFHYSPAYTGCCSTLHQEAWLVPPVVLQGSSQPCPHYSAATEVGPLCWIQHTGFGFLLLFILLWQSRGILDRNIETAPTATFPYVIISFPVSWSSFLPSCTFDVPDHFQINSLSRIIFYLLVTVLLSPYLNLTLLIPLPGSPWHCLALGTAAL